MSKKRERTVQSLHLAATKALKKAVAKAIAAHKSAGVPAAIWRDGKVAYLSGRRSRRAKG